MNHYHPTVSLKLPEPANPKHSDLNLSEVRGKGYRTIGGDKGDLHFQGYSVQDDETVLYKPVLVTTHEDLNPDEVNDIANEILQFSYESIGVETVQ